jgi:enoyl-CoA hydratase
MILSGAMIDAQEAWRMGLVNEVLPHAELIARASEILLQMTANAPLAIKFAIEAVNKGMETSLPDGLALEGSLFAICAATQDKAEGTAAFLAKRPATFHGR